VFAKDLLDEHESSVIRLAFMHYRYHIGGEWRPCYLAAAKDLLGRMRRILPCLPAERLDEILADLRECLDDDLDVSRGIHLLDVATRDMQVSGVAPAKEHLKSIERLLGITL
jgi:cysteinyl-tRNA synthetase